jgi:lantibiotic modifying enzyme
MKFIINKYLTKVQKAIDNITYEKDTLFSGKIGAIWQEYHLWQATNDRKHKAKTIQLINEIFEDLNNDNPKFIGTSYSSGAAGFCYVVTMLKKYNFLEISLDDDLADLDEHLYESALQFIDERNLDFWHGAFGIVFYFLERLDNPTIKQSTEILIGNILKKAIISNEGLWFSSIISEKDEGIINFSLSHGQTAFLIILMNAYNKGLCIDLIPEIIRQGTDFVLSHFEQTNFDNNKYSYFPSTINEGTGVKNFSNRLAFCYGDLNIVLLLYHASDFLGDPRLKQKADLLGLSSLMRKDEKTTQVTDAHFCHGSAGVAQFYKTLHRLTGIEAYHKGYEYWLDRTLDFIDEALQKDTFGKEKGSLLSGYVGISLVLLSYVSKEQLSWEKMFLL